MLFQKLSDFVGQGRYCRSYYVDHSGRHTDLYQYPNFAVDLPQQNCTKLFLLQKKAVRIVTKSRFLEHTTPVCSTTVRVLKLADLDSFNLGKFMYKYKCGILPANFNDCFTLSSSVHSHNTRGASKGDFHINFSRTSYSKNSLISNGIIFWNNLQTIKQSLTLESFSRKNKTSFLKY